MGSQKHLQSESGSWKLERSWCHLAGVSGAFPHVHVKSSCRASDSSLMSPPHLCPVQGGWHAAGVEARDCKMCCSSVKGGFSHRIKNAWGTSWCHERSKSSLLFLPLFFAFDQTKQVFGNCCVGKATGVFWNQALSCRGYFCHTSRGFNLLYHPFLCGSQNDWAKCVYIVQES